ncbi:hypothetical protein RND81_13G026100 [Saponaria officinalis]|uniref:GAG-pre-integrase domain-containing protein n=1 Tax=Saponaria officinalis TaxID=3572 RepID=A0AAW1H1S5_SAPOF
MMYVNSSKQLWDEIGERYNQSNAPYLYQLRKSMVHLEQSGQPVVQYFGCLKSIWEDLSSLDPLPECDCDAIKACSCNIMKKIVDRDNKNRLLDFLMGEAHQTVAAQTLRRDNKRSRTPLECDYCGKRGHTRPYCFKLKAHKKAKGAVKTDFRGRIAAHVEETQFNVEETPLGDDTAYGTHPKPSVGTNKFQFDHAMVQEFYQEVQKMMQGKGVEFTQGSASAHNLNLAGMVYASHVETQILAVPYDCWIIDSGASDHMTHDSQQFISSKVLSKPLKVNLPDGTIKEVKMDLITKDLITKETVCSGERSGGVYHLCPRDHVASTSYIGNKCLSCNHVLSDKQIRKDNLMLFYSRLGHSSLSKLKHVAVVSVPKDAVLECEVCVLAKHHKFPFPISTSIAAMPFDLVHMDL